MIPSEKDYANSLGTGRGITKRGLCQKLTELRVDISVLPPLSTATDSSQVPPFQATNETHGRSTALAQTGAAHPRLQCTSCTHRSSDPVQPSYFEREPCRGTSGRECNPRC